MTAPKGLKIGQLVAAVANEVENVTQRDIVDVTVEQGEAKGRRFATVSVTIDLGKVRTSLGDPVASAGRIEVGR